MSNDNDSITTAHDLQFAAIRERCEQLSAAMDRISTAIDEYRPGLEPGTFGRFVADTVAGAAPRLVSDVAMGPESTSGNEPWFAPGGDHLAPVGGGL